MKRKGFTLIDLLYTMIIISAVASLAISMDYIYSKDRAKDLNSNHETMISLSEDIEKSISDFGAPVKINSSYITFFDPVSGCNFSYYFTKTLDILDKKVESSCTNNISSRTLYIDNIKDITFTSHGNSIFSIEIEQLQSKRTFPFKYYFHTPLYTLD